MECNTIMEFLDTSKVSEKKSVILDENNKLITVEFCNGVVVDFRNSKAEFYIDKE